MEQGPRTIVDLADTAYRIESLKAGKAVLRLGNDRELWARVATPMKGYAIRIDGLEFEFQEALPALSRRALARL